MQERLSPAIAIHHYEMKRIRASYSTPHAEFKKMVNQ